MLFLLFLTLISAQSYTVTSVWSNTNCTGQIVGKRIKNVNPGSCFTTACSTPSGGGLSSNTTCFTSVLPSLTVPVGWNAKAAYLNSQTCNDANILDLIMVQGSNICLPFPSSTGGNRLSCNATHGFVATFTTNDCSTPSSQTAVSVFGCLVTAVTDSDRFTCNATAPTTTTTTVRATTVPLSATTTRPASGCRLTASLLLFLLAIVNTLF